MDKDLNIAHAQRGRASCTRRRITAAGGDRMAAHGLAVQVVDDDPIMLKLAAAMLGKIGFIVRTGQRRRAGAFGF